MKIKNFKCNELSQYIDSMLFDSGEVIAVMEVEDNGKKIEISLEVRGEVRVDFDGVVYCRPSEFPDVLKELIETNPGCWDCEDYMYVDMNNWFECMYTVQTNDREYSDGVMCEWDISKVTPEDIKREMLKVCEWILGEVKFLEDLNENGW